MAKKDEEWDKCWQWEGSPWKSRAAWMSYLRSALRKAWMRNPAKLEKLKQGRIKIPNPNPKSVTRFPEVLGAKCECCAGFFPLSAGKKEAKNKDYIVVDHIHPAGEFKEPKHFQAFFMGLLCITPDDLRLLCTSCNATYLMVQKQGVSFEEAKAIKKAIEIQKTKGGDVKWLENCGIIPASNSVRRRAQIVEKLLEGDVNGNIC